MRRLNSYAARLVKYLIYFKKNTWYFILYFILLKELFTNNKNMKEWYGHKKGEFN